jgi:hypothetical protein
LDCKKFVEGNYTTRLIGEDFQYKDPEVESNDIKLAIVATAVSAYNREFRGAKNGDCSDNNAWRSHARQEGLR